jgi:apolipoprotein N-acyltransferase
MPADTPIAALAKRVGSLSGWRHRLAAAGAGAASVLAMAPFHFWPVLWVTLPLLVWLIDGAMARCVENGIARRITAAAGTGWWWGFGYFLAGLYWIGEPFLVEAETFAALIPLAVTLMPAGLALFTAMATGLAATAWTAGAARVLALALALSATEWLRGHILTGFPWNVLGYALTYPIELMQSAAVLGIYGLTLAAVLVFALPAILWAETAERRRGRLGALLVALMPLLIAGAAGRARLAYATADVVPDTKVRIVQAGIPQQKRMRPELWASHFQDHLDLSGKDPIGKADKLAGVTLVIWPETAMPFAALDTPAALSALGDLLPDGTSLISGAIRIERGGADGKRPLRFFNSLLVLGKGGFLVALYDKVFLVPFGEFLPFRPLLAALGLNEVAQRGGFSTGIQPRPLLAIPGLPAAVVPLICYEAIFPGAVVQGGSPTAQAGAQADEGALPQQKRPGVIVNITNDGWFGNTTGPRQHLHQARVRAVEEGLPLLRAANSGVSAAFDAYGRPMGHLDLNARGTLDVPLAVALAPPPYARLGEIFFLAGWLTGAALLCRVMLRQ